MVYQGLSQTFAFFFRHPLPHPHPPSLSLYLPASVSWVIPGTATLRWSFVRVMCLRPETGFQIIRYCRLRYCRWLNQWDIHPSNQILSHSYAHSQQTEEVPDQVWEASTDSWNHDQLGHRSESWVHTYILVLRVSWWDRKLIDHQSMLVVFENPQPGIHLSKSTGSPKEARSMVAWLDCPVPMSCTRPSTDGSFKLIPLAFFNATARSGLRAPLCFALFVNKKKKKKGHSTFASGHIYLYLREDYFFFKKKDPVWVPSTWSLTGPNLDVLSAPTLRLTYSWSSTFRSLILKKENWTWGGMWWGFYVQYRFVSLSRGKAWGWGPDGDFKNSPPSTFEKPTYSYFLLLLSLSLSTTFPLSSIPHCLHPSIHSLEVELYCTQSHQLATSVLSTYSTSSSISKVLDLQTKTNSNPNLKTKAKVISNRVKSKESELTQYLPPSSLSSFPSTLPWVTSFHLLASHPHHTPQSRFSLSYKIAFQAFLRSRIYPSALHSSRVRMFPLFWGGRGGFVGFLKAWPDFSYLFWHDDDTFLRAYISQTYPSAEKSSRSCSLTLSFFQPTSVFIISLFLCDAFFFKSQYVTTTVLFFPPFSIFFIFSFSLLTSTFKTLTLGWESDFFEWIHS